MRRAGAHQRMFAARGYNIESLAVGTTQTRRSRKSRWPARRGKVIGQILQQLSKMVDVIRVVDMATPAMSSAN